MRRIRSKDTKPEMAVRSLLHGMGYRYRLHRKDLPGKPDLVFGPRRKVIFVHGCFWHLHPDPNCVDARLPKSNLEYWEKKLQRNIERDAANRKQLETDGWTVAVVWACQVKDLDQLAQTLTAFLA